MFSFHSHKAGGFLANGGTFHQHADAVFSGSNIRFLQAKCCALAAGLRTTIAGVNAFLILIRTVCYNAHFKNLLYALNLLCVFNGLILKKPYTKVTQY